MATFYRVRFIRGHPYLYREERWREKGRMKSKSKCVGRYNGYTGPPSTTPPQSGGSGSSGVPLTSDGMFGPRPARATVAEWESHKARARQYLLESDRRKTAPNSFENRERAYKVSHPTASYRAEAQYRALREEVQNEDKALEKAEKYFPQGSPTQDEEVMHAQWSANQAAERVELEAEYEEVMSVENSSP